MPNEQIFSHHHFDYHSLMRVPSVCNVCAECVCGVQFDFSFEAAVRAKWINDLRASLTQQRIHAMLPCLGKSLINRVQFLLAHTHTHVYTCGAYCGTAGHLDLGQRYWQLAETNNWRVLCAASKF